RMSAGVCHPDIGFRIAADTSLAVDVERNQRAVDGVASGTLECPLRPRLPEGNRLLDHHGAFAGTDQLSARGQMAAEPGIERASLAVGPGHIVVDAHPGVGCFR